MEWNGMEWNGMEMERVLPTYAREMYNGLLFCTYLKYPTI